MVASARKSMGLASQHLERDCLVPLRNSREYPTSRHPALFTRGKAWDNVAVAMSFEDPSQTQPAVPPPDEVSADSDESFGDALRQFERFHFRPSGDNRQVDATVVSVTSDSVFLDVGFKTEGVLLRTAFENNAESVQPGDRILVSVKGRNEDGYYDLSRQKVAKVTDWASLEEAFAQKSTIVGVVTAVVKGGVTVDVGVRAFMPTSRTGTRDAQEMEKLVGQEITCRITKLDIADEDVVVDRRAVLEEQALASADNRRAGLKEGDVLEGTVRSLTSYGAFVDIGGIDGLLHVSDIAWTRIGSPEEVLSAGQQIEVKVLKLDPESKRISLGMKQLLPEPWDTAAGRYMPGQRVNGTVSRLTDFGAFVEVEPGVEGLIHISEMSWTKRVHRPSDILRQGDTVEVVVLAISQAERRLSLGLKQALGDPWADVAQRFPVGSTMEGPVTRLATFGAFVQLTEGVEGLIHISEITAERRLAHPGDMLRVNEVVKAQVLGIDSEKRQIKLSMKQLVPTDLDQFLQEHHVGDAVSGRVVTQTDGTAVIELGEGVFATCRSKDSPHQETKESAKGSVDLSSLTSLLQARWKGQSKSVLGNPDPLQVGQVRSFRISDIDGELKKIKVEMA
jgi:small subunit ribosomal protein S1